MRKNKGNITPAVLAAICLFAGLIFIGVSIWQYNRESYFLNRGVQTVAVIKKIETIGIGEDMRHKVYVEFEVNGARYYGRLDTYRTGMHVGQKVAIRYMPDHPSDFVYAEATFVMPTIFSAIGGLFTLFSMSYFTVKASKRLKAKRLKAHGREIEAEVVEVRTSYKIFIGGASPVKLICRDTDGREYTARLYSDGPYYKPGDKVKI